MTFPRRDLTRASVLPALGLCTLLLLTGCTGPGEGGTSPSSSATEGNGTAGPGGEGPSSGPAQEEPASELDRLLAAGPDDALRERAAKAVAQMSVEQRAGQVLVGQLGAAGTSPEELERLHLGGVIVMGDAVPQTGGQADLDALAEELTAVQEALRAGRDWSGVVSIDQEGGLVARVKEPLTEWPTPMSYGAALAGQDADEAVELTADGHRALAAELVELGFTVDFAPSVDVTIGAEDPVIGARSFGEDPEAVAELGAAAQRGLLESGVLGSPKHFPGHGSVDVDSHVTLPEQPLSVAELTERDWMPFDRLLEASSGGEAYVPMLMMGHLDVPELDAGVPSSVSAEAYRTLRGLGGGEAGDGYDGVVVTDALNMGALVERFGPDEAPVRALAAGADLLLMPSSIPGAHAALVSAVQDGEVPEERLTEAAERVVTMLMWRDALAGEVASSGSPREDTAQVSEQVSASAVTVVDGVCDAPLVTDSLQIRGGEEADRARLTEAAQEAGLSVGSGPVVTLVGSARGTGQGDVVVALDAPFGLAESTASEDGALVALYGRTPGAFDALVDVLTGEAEAPGALPVQVGDWPAGTGC